MNEAILKQDIEVLAGKRGNPDEAAARLKHLRTILLYHLPKRLALPKTTSFRVRMRMLINIQIHKLNPCILQRLPQLIRLRLKQLPRP